MAQLWLRHITVILALCVPLAGVRLASGQPLSQVMAAAVAPCNPVSGPKDVHLLAATSLSTVHEGYECILAHYVTASTTLDDRTLLRGAVAAVTFSLQQDGVPAPAQSAPALTGNRNHDWADFQSWYDVMVRGLPTTRLATYAEDALQGMTDALNDDHTAYVPPYFMKGEVAQLSNGPTPSFGLDTSPITNTVTLPIYITDVFTSGPAANAGLLPGDIVSAIDGVSPAANVFGLVSLLLPQAGAQTALTILRPSTGLTKTVVLTARTMLTPVVSSKLVGADIAYVKLYEFAADAYRQVQSALKSLSRTTTLKGVILDLRNDGGGDEGQAVQLISSFVHDGIIAYRVNGSGRRQPQRTDDAVPLLHLPLAVLVDGGSASASEILASTIKDYHAGQIVGQRSLGAVAEAEFYGLNDGGGLEITVSHLLGPDGEMLDGVGVEPTQVVATSPGDLSKGFDPAVSRAVQDLQMGSA